MVAGTRSGAGLSMIVGALAAPSLEEIRDAARSTGLGIQKVGLSGLNVELSTSILSISDIWNI
jgi:hypothetical protein